jgi:hypothetical protein
MPSDGGTPKHFIGATAKALDVSARQVQLHAGIGTVLDKNVLRVAGMPLSEVTELGVP